MDGSGGHDNAAADDDDVVMMTLGRCEMCKAYVHRPVRVMGGCYEPSLDWRPSWGA